MLSVNSLGNVKRDRSGQRRAANYYVDSTRADHAETGHHDPDLGGDVQGRWMALGPVSDPIRRLDDKPAHREGIEQALRGTLPDGRSVQNVGAAARQMGHDVTVNAPKSLSLLLEFGAAEASAAAERAHEAGVRAAARYLASEITTRRGHAGEAEEQGARWL